MPDYEMRMCIGQELWDQITAVYPVQYVLPEPAVCGTCLRLTVEQAAVLELPEPESAGQQHYSLSYQIRYSTGDMPKLWR